ncbi:hypothetical protein LOAG_09960 [Loa loa]|uniref:Uncharacterized protein n=1 Tax=Loa loa TaxID=7209 RepID=A0A1S0TSD5_LOALO|nr:hypothetical protein LOAG_09960 [Loa loa]EFO18534.1 hypothetical protein LOAG_09960 [Loa loa]
MERGIPALLRANRKTSTNTAVIDRFTCTRENYGTITSSHCATPLIVCSQLTITVLPQHRHLKISKRQTRFSLYRTFPGNTIPYGQTRISCSSNIESNNAAMDVQLECLISQIDVIHCKT